MRKNVGSLDKLIRILLAAVIAGLSYFNVIEGTLTIVLLVFACILVVTSFINFCPIYALIGKSSRQQ